MRDSRVTHNVGDGIVMDGPTRIVDTVVDHNSGAGLGGAGSVGSYPVTVAGLAENHHNGGVGVQSDTRSGMLIRDSSVHDNAGGGIYNNGGVIFRGVLTLDHSRVTGNRARIGGGIYTDGVLIIRDSVISGNTADTDGGGIFVGGGPGLTTLDVLRTTIKDNVATSGVGGGIYVAVDTGSEKQLTFRQVTFRHNSPDNCYGC